MDLCFCPGQVADCDSPTSVSGVTAVIGMYYYTWIRESFQITILLGRAGKPLKLTILLPLPPECWYYKHALWYMSHNSYPYGDTLAYRQQSM